MKVKEILKSNLIRSILTFIAVSLVVVLASDVIVKEGDITANKLCLDSGCLNAFSSDGTNVNLTSNLYLRDSSGSPWHAYNLHAGEVRAYQDQGTEWSGGAGDIIADDRLIASNNKAGASKVTIDGTGGKINLDSDNGFSVVFSDDFESNQKTSTTESVEFNTVTAGAFFGNLVLSSTQYVQFADSNYKIKYGGNQDINITANKTVNIKANLSVSNEASIGGISGDGAGKVVCIKSDGNLGTCTDQPGTSGTCTCS